MAITTLLVQLRDETHPVAGRQPPRSASRNPSAVSGRFVLLLPGDNDADRLRIALELGLAIEQNCGRESGRAGMMVSKSRLQTFRPARWYTQERCRSLA